MKKKLMWLLFCFSVLTLTPFGNPVNGDMSGIFGDPEVGPPHAKG